MTRVSRPDQLKAQLLSDAVADNVSTMNGELPKALQPRRRLGALWGPRLGVVALPIGIILAVVGVARQPSFGGMQRTAEKSTATATSASIATSLEHLSPSAATARAPLTAASLEPGALRRPVDPRVLELAVRRIVLDAGHGGDNHGTASAAGLEEKTLTLDIAQRARDALVTRGFDVVMTRSDDSSVSLQERAELANARQGDIFVSIHLNALQPASAKGIETYYLGAGDGSDRDTIAAVENQQSGYSLSDMRTLLERIYADARRDESRQLAETVQRALMRAAHQVDPGLTNRGVKRAPFVVLVATEMPAILAEVSCLSNADEVERLKTPGYRQTLAEALASGIQAFANAERTGSSGS